MIDLIRSLASNLYWKCSNEIILLFSIGAIKVLWKCPCSWWYPISFVILLFLLGFLHKYCYSFQNGERYCVWCLIFWWDKFKFYVQLDGIQYYWFNQIEFIVVKSLNFAQVSEILTVIEPDCLWQGLLSQGHWTARTMIDGHWSIDSNDRVRWLISRVDRFIMHSRMVR